MKLTHKMKMSMTDIAIAGCAAFAVCVLSIGYLVPAQAQQQPPVDEVLNDASNAFTVWGGGNTYMAKTMNALATAYRSMKAENAQLKDELAKAKALAPSPAPSSTSASPLPAK
jgi:hypothetical protein